MKQKYIILIGLVILSSFLLLTVSQKQKQPGMKKVSNHLFLSEDAREEKRIELFNKLLQANSFDDCDSVSKQIIKLGQICSQSEKRVLCMDPEQFYSEYMMQCLGNIAAKNDDVDVSICEDDEILDRIVLEKRKINTPLSPNEKTFLRQQCILSFIKNMEDLSGLGADVELLCNQFGGDNCFYYLALISKNYNFCSNISNYTNQGRCFAYFAFLNHDKKVCHGKDWQIEACKEAVDILENNDVSTCETIGRFYDTSSAPPVEGCYIGFALYKKDPSICNNIKSKYDYTSGSESLDFYLCRKLSNNKYK